MVCMKVYLFLLNSCSLANDFFCSVQLHPLCRIFHLSCSPVVATEDRINLSVGAASLYLSSALPRPNYHILKFFLAWLTTCQ